MGEVQQLCQCKPFKNLSCSDTNYEKRKCEYRYSAEFVKALGFDPAGAGRIKVDASEDASEASPMPRKKQVELWPKPGGLY